MIITDEKPQLKYFIDSDILQCSGRLKFLFIFLLLASQTGFQLK